MLIYRKKESQYCLLDSQTWRSLGASLLNAKYLCSDEHASVVDDIESQYLHS